MQPSIPHGTRRQTSRQGALVASTFVELVVTIFLLTVFAALVFPVFWSMSKASTSHAVENAAQQSKLTLVTILPRLAEEVRPPYWASQEKVFQQSGSECKVLYRNGKADDFLIFRKESDSSLSLVTTEETLSIDNLPGVTVDWWEKDERIVGVTVQWRQGRETVEFHAAWGSFIL